MSLFGRSLIRSEDELPTLIGLIPPQGRMLEIGTAAGATAALIADAHPNAIVVCIDSYIDILHPDVVSTDPDRLNNWHRNRRRNMNLWLGTIQELIRVLNPEAKFDVAFVDGDHAMLATYSDLVMAERLVTAGGVIVAHDYGDPNHAAVTAAVDRFCTDFRFRIERVVWALAVLRRGDNGA